MKYEIYVKTKDCIILFTIRAVSQEKAVELIHKLYNGYDYRIVCQGLT